MSVPPLRFLQDRLGVPAEVCHMHRARALFLPVLFVLALAVACGGSDTSGSDGASTVGRGPDGVTLRLGYFPNITHATGIVGVESGIFARNLGDNITLETATFNAGPAAVEALFSGAIDATYIGPNPAINA